MGIKHLKASEISPESKSALKVNDALTISTFDRDLQPSVAGARRLMPCVFVVEKAKPYTYTTFGSAVLYVIEGTLIIEDKITGRIAYTKGDVAIIDEGTVLAVFSPSKARLFAVDHIGAPSVITDGCS